MKADSAGLCPWVSPRLNHKSPTTAHPNKPHLVFISGKRPWSVWEVCETREGPGARDTSPPGSPGPRGMSILVQEAGGHWGDYLASSSRGLYASLWIHFPTHIYTHTRTTNCFTNHMCAAPKTRKWPVGLGEGQTGHMTRGSGWRIVPAIQPFICLLRATDTSHVLAPSSGRV